jgi:hypothetical protein
MSTCERGHVSLRPCIVLMSQPRLFLMCLEKSISSMILLTSDLAFKRSTPTVGLSVADIAVRYQLEFNNEATEGRPDPCRFSSSLESHVLDGETSSDVLYR